MCLDSTDNVPYRKLLDGNLHKDHISECWGSAANAAAEACRWAKMEAGRLKSYKEGSWQATAMDVYRQMYATAEGVRNSNEVDSAKKNSLLVIRVPADTTQSDEVDELAQRMIVEHVARSGSMDNYRAHSAATITTLEKSIDVFGQIHGNDDPEFLNVYNVWRRSDAPTFIRRMGVHAFKRAGLSVVFVRRPLHYRDYSMYGIWITGYTLVEQGQAANLQNVYVCKDRSTKKRSRDQINVASNKKPRVSNE